MRNLDYKKLIHYHPNITGLKVTLARTERLYAEGYADFESCLVKADWVDRYSLIRMYQSYMEQNPWLGTNERFLAEIHRLLDPPPKPATKKPRPKHEMDVVVMSRDATGDTWPDKTLPFYLLVDGREIFSASHLRHAIHFAHRIREAIDFPGFKREWWDDPKWFTEMQKYMGLQMAGV